MMKMNELLLHWYDENARPLPWRGSGDPYRIWLSEIMLQQTRAETVIRYYERFLARFPTVHALAQAQQDEVLKLWEGLGYYSRARNLHAAAKRISEDFGGVFPDSVEKLEKLPGIGPYAARAIASIAWNRCVPALDGNQMRVLSRCHAVERTLKTPFDLMEEAMESISRSRPGDYNQALMDLGSGICTPRNPKCAVCPLASVCRARADGEAERYPLRPAPVPKRDEDHTILLIQQEDKICIRKRADKKLLGGLYEFPMIEGHFSRGEIENQLLEAGYGQISDIRPLPPGRHVFTHLVWHMQGWFARAGKIAPDATPVCAEEITALAFPSAIRQYRELALEALSEEQSKNELND